MSLGGLKILQDKVESVYLVKDPYITELMVAAVLTHRLSSDPAWMIIVAPSGGAKSEFVNSISQCEGIYPLSTITSHTFISGAKANGKETSLLQKIQNGIITFKDFTSLMSEQRDERAVIMAQLREIYDGKLSKSFGTGETVNWEGKITVIAGATFVIHTLKQTYTAMGERFLIYNMEQPDRIEAARRTMENQEEGKMAEHRAMIASAFKNYLDVELEIPKEMPKISNELRDELLLLAELATRARSDVERNWRSPQQEITDAHPPEMPTRFAGQLQAFARAFQIINRNETGTDGLAEHHRHILYKLALDSITKSRRTALNVLAKYDTIETAGMAVKLGFPTNTVRRWVEDLTALGITEREKGGGSKGDRWTLKPAYRDIIQKFENIKTEGAELTEENADSSLTVAPATASVEEAISAGIPADFF